MPKFKTAREKRNAMGKMIKRRADMIHAKQYDSPEFEKLEMQIYKLIGGYYGWKPGMEVKD